VGVLAELLLLLGPTRGFDTAAEPGDLPIDVGISTKTVFGGVTTTDPCGNCAFEIGENGSGFPAAVVGVFGSGVENGDFLADGSFFVSAVGFFDSAADALGCISDTDSSRGFAETGFRADLGGTGDWDFAEASAVSRFTTDEFAWPITCSTVSENRTPVEARVFDLVLDTSSLFDVDMVERLLDLRLVAGVSSSLLLALLSTIAISLALAVPILSERGWGIAVTSLLLLPLISGVSVARLLLSRDCFRTPPVIVILISLLAAVSSLKKFSAEWN
jgi:hypothetical protein